MLRDIRADPQRTDDFEKGIASFLVSIIRGAFFETIRVYSFFFLYGTVEKVTAV